MPQSYTNLIYHILFSTKGRFPWIQQKWRARLHPYLGGICRELDCALLEAGGVEDHMHLLVRGHPTMAVATLVGKVKANSSRWIAETFECRAFFWQTGYTALTVSESVVPKVRRYIQNQEAHHNGKGFIEELKELLELNGIRFDEGRLE